MLGLGEFERQQRACEAEANCSESKRDATTRDRPRDGEFEQGAPVRRETPEGHVAAEGTEGGGGQQQW